MKLNRKKSKVKKKAPASSIGSKADELGAEYDEVNEVIAVKGKELSSLKERIKGLARSKGTIDGKQTTIEGDKYRVGFSTTEPGQVADLALCKRHLPNAILKKVITIVEVLDVELLHDLFEQDKVDANLLDDILVPRGSKSERILIKKKGK